MTLELWAAPLMRHSGLAQRMTGVGVPCPPPQTPFFAHPTPPAQKLFDKCYFPFMTSALAAQWWVGCAWDLT